MALQIECGLQTASAFDDKQLRSKIAYQRLRDVLAGNPAAGTGYCIGAHIHAAAQDRVCLLSSSGRLCRKQRTLLPKFLAPADRNKFAERCKNTRSILARH